MGVFNDVVDKKMGSHITGFPGIEIPIPFHVKQICKLILNPYSKYKKMF